MLFSSAVRHLKGLTKSSQQHVGGPHCPDFTQDCVGKKAIELGCEPESG